MPNLNEAHHKAALAYRMIATAMREERSPLEDMEILALAENFAVRQPDPLRAKDDLILGLTYILSGLLVAAAADRGETREQAAQEVLILAAMIETGQVPGP